MKKNLTFKIGLFCAALVLIATCFVTNAWAKYTKTVSSSDSARVAKFDVNFSNDGKVYADTLTLDIFTTTFENVYHTTEGKNVYSTGEGENVVSQKLVAPGSYGQFVVIVENLSEVDVKVTYNAKVTRTAEVENVEYTVPIEFSLDKNTWSDDLDSLFTDVELDANADNKEAVYTIYWQWTSANDNGATDTKLGEAAQKGDIVVKVELEVVAEQVIATKTTA